MLKVVTRPAVEPVTLAEAKLFLKVDIPDDDPIVAGLIASARRLCEKEVARSFISTGWRLTLDGFPLWGRMPYPGRSLERQLIGTLTPIRLPISSVLEVTSIRYVDTGGAVQTLDPSLYQAEAGDAARIVPAYGHSWPSTRTLPEAVTVDFTAGYGPSAEDVDPPAKTAVLLTLSHLYYNRGDADGELPQTIKDVLAAVDWGSYG